MGRICFGLFFDNWFLLKNYYSYNRDALLFITLGPVAGTYSSLSQLLTPSLLRTYQCLCFTGEEIEVKDFWYLTALTCVLELWGWWKEGGPVNPSSLWLQSSALPPPPLHFIVIMDVDVEEEWEGSHQHPSGGYQLLPPCGYHFTSCFVPIFTNWRALPRPPERLFDKLRL